jgi:hypothetical protein
MQKRLLGLALLETTAYSDVNDGDVPHGAGLYSVSFRPDLFKTAALSHTTFH